MATQLFHSDRWPTCEQTLLLKAAIHPEEQAISFWNDWRSNHSLELMDALSYGIAPQVYNNLKGQNISDVDRGILRGIYRYNWTKNKMALNGFQRILDLLVKENVDAMAIKGVPLLLTSYEDHGARMMNDVDIVVHEHVVPRLAAALYANGWSSPSPINWDKSRQTVHGFSFKHEKHGRLDLHWRLLSIDCHKEVEQGIWRSAHTLPEPFSALRAPCATDTLLISCYHGRKLDGSVNLRWLIDFARVANFTKDEIDWNAFIDRSKQAGLLPLVQDVFTYLTHEIKLTELIPADVIGKTLAIKPRKEDVVRYRLIATDHDQRSTFERVYYRWWCYSAGFRRRGRKPQVSDVARFFYLQKRTICDVRTWWRMAQRSIARCKTPPLI